jgi:DNA-binding NarL/FixJ family response regulator
MLRAGPLTRREWEVAELVAQGSTNRAIAARLCLSERTAQNHVQHILTKLDLTNRSQLATWVAHQDVSSRS